MHLQFKFTEVSHIESILYVCVYVNVAEGTNQLTLSCCTNGFVQGGEITHVVEVYLTVLNETSGFIAVNNHVLECVL